MFSCGDLFPTRENGENPRGDVDFMETTGSIGFQEPPAHEGRPAIHLTIQTGES